MTAIVGAHRRTESASTPGEFKMESKEQRYREDDIKKRSDSAANSDRDKRAKDQAPAKSLHDDEMPAIPARFVVDRLASKFASELSALHGRHRTLTTAIQLPGRRVVAALRSLRWPSRTGA